MNNFILPLFVHDGDENQPIPSMPGVSRLSFKNGVNDFVAEARSYGVNQVVIFPKARSPVPASQAPCAFCLSQRHLRSVWRGCVRMRSCVHACTT